MFRIIEQTQKKMSLSLSCLLWNDLSSLCHPLELWYWFFVSPLIFWIVLLDRSSSYLFLPRKNCLALTRICSQEEGLRCRAAQHSKKRGVGRGWRWISWACHQQMKLVNVEIVRKKRPSLNKILDKNSEVKDTRDIRWVVVDGIDKMGLKVRVFSVRMRH